MPLPGAGDDALHARPAPDAFIAGLALTLLVHGGLVGIYYYMSHRPPKNVVHVATPFITATVARLGQPRDMSWLPHKAPPRGAHRNRGPAYTMDETAAPRPISKDKNEQVDTTPKDTPDQNLQSAADLARQLAQTEAANGQDDSTGPAKQYGSANGSPWGNSETGTVDPWIAALIHALQWQVPATIAPAQAASLYCDATLEIKGNVLSDYAIHDCSKNSLFRQAVELTLEQAKTQKLHLPDTPAKFKDAAEAGSLGIRFTGQQ